MNEAYRRIRRHLREDEANEMSGGDWRIRIVKSVDLPTYLLTAFCNAVSNEQQPLETAPLARGRLAAGGLRLQICRSWGLDRSGSCQERLSRGGLLSDVQPQPAVVLDEQADSRRSYVLCEL